MAEQRFPMTAWGFEKAKTELKRLKSEERPQNVRDIEEARAHGDLSENAEYHAAKERQGMIDAKIRDLEARVARAQVIDISNLTGDKVMFGCTVTLMDVDTEDKTTYHVLGDEESDMKRGIISVNSPMARALLGHRLGDEVTVRTPKGERSFEIVELKFNAITL